MFIESFLAQNVFAKMFSIKLMFVISALLVVLVNCDPTMYKKNEQNVYEAGEINICKKLWFITDKQYVNDVMAVSI